ncbi:hypothetical protein EVAR_94388_1 [Eumeta japonica]|uniref:Uncharacterized protein n=1 Tax=Eumeta variegata TaxID=151549 RepID=A0A4C1TQ02_EUMVA|nr:hypothetical protein EVAR_94388_1 [Eumeta japonica]
MLGTTQSSRASPKALRLVTEDSLLQRNPCASSSDHCRVEGWSRSRPTGTRAGGSTSPFWAFVGVLLESIDTVGFFLFAWDVLVPCRSVHPQKNADSYISTNVSGVLKLSTDALQPSHVTFTRATSDTPKGGRSPSTSSRRQ